MELIIIAVVVVVAYVGYKIYTSNVTVTELFADNATQAPYKTETPEATPALKEEILAMPEEPKAAPAAMTAKAKAPAKAKDPVKAPAKAKAPVKPKATTPPKVAAKPKAVTKPKAPAKPKTPSKKT